LDSLSNDDSIKVDEPQNVASQNVVFLVGESEKVDDEKRRLENVDENRPLKVKSVARKCRIEKESGSLSMTQIAAIQTDFPV
jgi:hypothetical protein